MIHLTSTTAPTSFGIRSSTSIPDSDNSKRIEFIEFILEPLLLKLRLLQGQKPINDFVQASVAVRRTLGCYKLELAYHTEIISILDGQAQHYKTRDRILLMPISIMLYFQPTKMKLAWVSHQFIVTSGSQ